LPTNGGECIGQGWPTRPVLAAALYEATINKSHEGA
jgi:hypothetical protein